MPHVKEDVFGWPRLTVPSSQHTRLQDRWSISWRFASWGVALFALLLRLGYLWFLCPYDLSPDEAHYWDWSRHLDWSYYSKGPGVAWLIAASTALFGHAMWAVRLPAVVSGSLILLGLHELTWRVYRQGRMAFAVVVLALSIPPLAAGSLLMTIDSPYVCCWTWALVLAHAACFPEPEGSGRGQVLRWFALGCLIGLGILFKYTMVLFLPSLLLFAAITRLGKWNAVRLSGTLGEVTALLVPIGLSVLPILIWNANHGWVTLLHVGRQAGVQSAGILWLGPLTYLAGQAAVLMGFWFVFIAGAVLAALGQVIGWPRRVSKPASVPASLDDDISPGSWIAPSQAAFLLSFFLPMFGVFLAFSLKTRIELNWPITAYISGGVLAAGWVTAHCQSAVRWWRRLSRSSLAVAAGSGFLIVILMHNTEWVYPLLPKQGQGQQGVASGPRRWDPTCRLRGWQTLAAEVEAIRTQLRQQGIEPVVVAGGWALPGELAFYLPDHPPVYSIGSANGGRLSQYDVWRPNPVWDPEQFRGRTMICVGDLSPTARRAFGRIEGPHYVVHHVAGHPVACWPVSICHDFRGFAEVHPQGF